MLDQNPAADEERRQGSRVTIVVGRVGRGDPDADADAHDGAMRVAVLAGGRSSEHEVSLQLGRVRARGAWPRRATRCCR